MRFSVIVAAAVLGSALSGAAVADPVQGAKPQNMDERFVPDPRTHKVSTWVSGLDTPWALVFLPDGRALVTERPGRIRLIEGGSLLPDPVATVEAARGGEGGLMGLALHPRFPAEPFFFTMHTAAEKGARINRVTRWRFDGKRARVDKVLIENIPGSANHDGGRLAFGPDGYLYVGTGDAFDPDAAQDPASLAGKILRIGPDGTPPAGNVSPGSLVYALGFRNVQGFAWSPETREMFAGDHGPSGEFLLFSHDEINVVRPGGNYGWPLAVGAPGQPSWVDPVVAWNDITTPPTGMAFWEGALFVGTLASEAVVRIELERSGEAWRAKAIERWFADGGTEGKLGRFRDVVVGPDKALYILTSNRDGRGTPREGDDRIVRIEPEAAQ